MRNRHDPLRVGGIPKDLGIAELLLVLALIPQGRVVLPLLEGVASVVAVGNVLRLFVGRVERVDGDDSNERREVRSAFRPGA